MSSIFNKVSTRMFCISGELSDIFCMQNGWILNFEELLVQRLQALGYESVVFCSSQRELFYAINPAGTDAFPILEGKKQTAAPAKPAPAPVQSVSDYDDLDDDDDDFAISSAPVQSQPAAAKTEKREYTLRRITGERLPVAANRFMLDTQRRKALVFTSLED